MRADLFAEVRDAHDDVGQAVRHEALELPVDERPAGDLEHRLGHGERLRTHPRRQTSREDDRLGGVRLHGRRWHPEKPRHAVAHGAGWDGGRPALAGERGRHA